MSGTACRLMVFVKPTVGVVVTCSHELHVLKGSILKALTAACMTFMQRKQVSCWRTCCWPTVQDLLLTQQHCAYLWLQLKLTEKHLVTDSM